MKAPPITDIELLSCIVHFQDAEGVPPTMREMSAMLGYAAHSAVEHRLNQLEDKGYLVRQRRRARSIKLLGQAYSLLEESKAS